MNPNTHPNNLKLIRRLCHELSHEQINYCHWKSNAALDKSALGENDLDLLIDRKDALRFVHILSGSGFKEFLAPGALDIPGISNYFGHDQDADKIVHVHAHYQLVLGHDLKKNFHIPVEQAYLDSSVQSDLFRVPTPEFELIIFVIRMMIKHFQWDTIIGRQGKLSKNEQIELTFLIKRANIVKIHRLVQLFFPFIEIDLLDDCLKAVQQRGSFWFKLNTGARLTNRLKSFAQEPYFVNAIHKQWNRVRGIVQSRLLHKIQHSKSANGGLMVAIIGGDGAGKTTALDGLYQWIAPRFGTARFHMGKPRWSLSTILIRGGLKIGSLVGRKQIADAHSTSEGTQSATKSPSYTQALRALCTAHDRCITYAKAFRFASDGGIALCDRFPLPQVVPMDGPQIERMLGGHPGNRLFQYLMRKERAYYDQIRTPDLMIVLLLNPEIAVLRKSDENGTFVNHRSTQVWQANWADTPAFVIDASQSKEKVLSEIKSLVWPRV